MIEKIELEMISRRRIVSFLGFAAALASRFQPLTLGHRRPAWSDVKSGVKGASNGVTSGAEARLHQNSLYKASLFQHQHQHQPSLYRNS